MKIFNIILTFLILSSCLSKQKNVKINSNITTPIKDVNILMENDTLGKKEEKGKILLFYKLNDTIKLSSSDDRNILIFLSLKSDDKKNKPSEVIEKELNFKNITYEGNIEIPFKIKPHFLGKGSLACVIIDVYNLNSYNQNDKIRRIEYDITFEKEIFIK